MQGRSDAQHSMRLLLEQRFGAHGKVLCPLSEILTISMVPWAIGIPTMKSQISFVFFKFFIILSSLKEKIHVRLQRLTKTYVSLFLDGTVSTLVISHLLKH